MTATTTQVGRFRFTPATGRWWWSDHMFLIHGMQPGDVVPTRALLLAHVEPGDRPAVAAALERCVAETEPRGCEYGLLDLTGSAHRVAMAVAGDCAGALAGSLLDVTAAQDALVAERVNTELARALESHAAIDQAKGILMLAYGVDEDAAFEMLRASSQQHNVRLRALAGRVVDAAAHGLEPPARECLDALLCAEPAAPTPPTAARHGPELLIRAEVVDGRSVLRVSGAVDLSSKAELARAVSLAMLRAAESGAFTLDLRGLVRIGPATADVLATALRQSAAHGIGVTILGGAACAGTREVSSAPARAATARRG